MATKPTPNQKGTIKPPMALPDAQKLKDDVYEYKSNEFDQIRTCIGMYVGSDAQTGSLHLLNEIVTNSIDEETNPNSDGDTIWVNFFEADKKFIVEDNGRGIPLDILFDVINKKHYSTKFNREFNRYSGGQNGVGTTITAALSDHYLITCYRDGKQRTVYMAGNELIDDGIKKSKSADKHGTYTEFIPSQKWLGRFTMTCEDVEDYLRHLSYIIPEHIKLKYALYNKKGKSTAKTLKYQGLAADVSWMTSSPEFAPVTLSIPEIKVRGENGDEDQYFKMEFAFTYDRTLDETVTDSFCNYLHTKEGGCHEQAVQQAICQFFTRQAKLLDPNNKFEVTADDCKKGLVFAVNCDHSDPKFEGQHKSKMSQKNVLYYGKPPLINVLTQYFETNNGLLRRIVQYLRQISKIRQEAHKIKAVTLKKPSTFLDDAEMKIFTNISDRNYTGYKELILAEGDSAIAAVGSARNVKCQAILAVTGVVANTFDMSPQSVMTSNTYQTLIKVLGCGFGKDFNIDKLKWNAILITTDGDVDGHNITSLLCVFFAVHMPEIIKAGKLYKCVPPLYRIDEKEAKRFNNGKEYVFDKMEYYGLYHRVVADHLDFSIVTPRKKSDLTNGHGDVEMLSRKQRIAFMDSVIDYLPELQTLSKRSSCDIDILENICYFLMMTENRPNPKDSFEELLTRKYPELHYDPMYESIIGSVDGRYVSLIIDRIFMKMAKRMFRLMADAPTYYVLVRNNDKQRDDPKDDDWESMSLGQFLKMAEDSYHLDIEQRYKGLGESDASMVFPSMTNPKTRKIMRITMEDAVAAMETLKLLHGNSEELREARRQLLANADITLQDIDN